MNVPTGEFRALSDQAAEADGYRRREALLIRTLSAELAGSEGPLGSDDFLRGMARMVVESHQQLTELRASLGIPGQAVRERQFHVIEGGKR